MVQALDFLLKSPFINMNTKNLENKTALDMAVNVEIKSVLLRAGAKPSSQVTDVPTFPRRIPLSMYPDKVVRNILCIRQGISEDKRSTWMIVATLVATATYQSALSPTGGIYQVNASENNVNIVSSNSTRGNAGKSVLSGTDFFVFSFFNMSSFLLSILGILLMIPNGIVASIVGVPVVLFAGCYLFSMWRLSPTHVNSIIFLIIFASIVSLVLIDVITAVSFILKHIVVRNIKKFY